MKGKMSTKETPNEVAMDNVNEETSVLAMCSNQLLKNNNNKLKTCIIWLLYTVLFQAYLFHLSDLPILDDELRDLKYCSFLSCQPLYRPGHVRLQQDHT